MAESSISVSQDQFSCPVCLDLLKDPVTIPCGHSYCMRCITGYWDHEDQKNIYRCPQCRQTFTPRPVLGKNVVVAEMVEKLQKKRIKTPRHHTVVEDVECGVCTGRKHKAIKSCLVCLNSYCQTHLEQHENLFRGKRHNLTEPTGGLQEMICSRHDKMMDIYCHTDQRCICMLCMVDEHRNHHTVSIGAARTEKQSQLEETQTKLQQNIQKREKDLQKLRETVESHKRSAQTAVKDCDMMFTELISSIERSRSEVTQRIRDQEKAAVSRAEGLLEQLKQEIDDLKRRNAELEQLSHTDHHIRFLQSFQSVSLSGSTDSISVCPDLSFDDVVRSVSQFREKLQCFCSEEMDKISAQHCLTPILRSRKDFLRYFHQFTLDPNTVNHFLRLSEGNRAVTVTDTDHQYPDHPDRFDSWAEVLCRDSVSGRCYWEVEWSGRGGLGVDIAVTYKSVSRKGDGDDCVVGRNDQSWNLFCSPESFSFRHNNIETKLPVVSNCSRIGVYVDHSAGSLSFYSVSDTMTLIHRVQTTFTQPLYPVFGLDDHSFVKLCLQSLAKTC